MKGEKMKGNKINKTLCAIVAGLSLNACILVDESDAKRAAYSAGWKDVNVTATETWFNYTCGENEIAFRIAGENPRGDKSNATVCCGYNGMKGCTIRY